MANLYDLKKFDLNLLVIFECIYQHLSISKAAETLFITPSAVSQSLQRLRTQLNDPLFVRSGKGITPTTVGMNLHHHLEKNLNQLEKTINIANHSELSKRFVIYSPQLLISPATMDLINKLHMDPNLQIDHRDLLLSPESVEDLMAYRKADLIYSITPLSNHSTICQPFQELEIALVCREGHPRADHLNSFEEVSREGFTLYTSSDPNVKAFQQHGRDLMPERRIAFRSNSLIAILTTINQSDLIGFVPKHALSYFSASFKFREIILPVPIPPVTAYMIYNRSSLNNPKFAEFITQNTTVN
ncbi:TPA: LysR family transcriptional regulator [Klebsiella aerogenes]|uniref:DNA-binding transcriptional repressor CitR n=1 Tax=Klebsiella TaxID=570 RepID=UPI00277C8FE8|nr:LysR family transcriptional regulator [Klebsiella aerogenes]WPS48965.1 LysR family transcriptional regulator [Klebsiella aerogenes]HBS0235000.1 LysR family transcriptional regulator [Klebsiella aerogenes]HDS7134253.1 LysR family transcriptional regulator [Klebsiella aerogenes]HDU3668886.1 LysR family transcriptional regulator [Klebsiella aerogenes]HDU3693930.1 LysR family transcriptional regulator [Klebsiella aerogenes]